MSTKQSTGHPDTAHLQERKTVPEYFRILWGSSASTLVWFTPAELSRKFSVTSSNVSSVHMIEATITTAV